MHQEKTPTIYFLSHKSITKHPELAVALGTLLGLCRLSLPLTGSRKPQKTTNLQKAGQDTQILPDRTPCLDLQYLSTSPSMDLCQVLVL